MRLQSTASICQLLNPLSCLAVFAFHAHNLPNPSLLTMFSIFLLVVFLVCTGFTSANTGSSLVAAAFDRYDLVTRDEQAVFVPVHSHEQAVFYYVNGKNRCSPSLYYCRFFHKL